MEYDTKSGYFIVESWSRQPEERPHQDLEWTSVIWKGEFSQKLKVFLWRCVLQAIATGENLSKRGISINTGCIHYGEVELTTKLLFQCPYTRRVWPLAPFTETLDSMQIAELKTSLKMGVKLVVSASDWNYSRSNLHVALLGIIGSS